MRISRHILARTLATFFLLATFHQSAQALFIEPFVIPNNTNEYLRHEKHGILAFGASEDGRYGSFLITRSKTYYHNGELSPSKDLLIKKYIYGIHDDPGRDSISTEELYDLSHEMYRLLIQPFRKELDELYQLTICHGEQEYSAFPFESFVIDGSGPYHKRKFLTEVWAISYLNHFDFLPVEQRGDPPPVQVDAEGSYCGKLPHPNQGSVLCNRSGEANWLPKDTERRFWENVEAGNYIDEALGLARVAYFDSLRALSSEESIHAGLDPRNWADAVILGDIAPTHPKRGFPWWVLAPIGLLLVIVFGRKL